VFKNLKVSVAILNLIRASTGSQWSLLRVDELESMKPVVPVTTHARVFCVMILVSRNIRFMRIFTGVPYIRGAK